VNDRWLPPRAAGLGLLIGVVVFLTLHLVLDASVLGSLTWLLAGGAITTALVLHVRRVELLRTRQAQGYFVSAMMIAGITLAWLPPGTVGDALQTGTRSPTIEVREQQDDHQESTGVWTGIYPGASDAVQQLVEVAKDDFALSDTTIQSISVTSDTVVVVVFDPTSDVARGYSMDRDGTIYQPSVSNVDPNAIHEFALSAVLVDDLNELVDAASSALGIEASGDDVLNVSAFAEGAAPYITIGFGPPHDRVEVYADASGTFQDGPG
jgi:hypothetical protein